MLIDDLITNHEIVAKMFPENSIRKNHFLAACKLFLEQDSKSFRRKLRFVNTYAPYGGIIGPGNSKLESVLEKCKVIRLHAVLHDAAGFVRKTFNAGPGYAYCSACVPSTNAFCGQVSGIMYCLFLKIFYCNRFRKLKV